MKSQTPRPVSPVVSGDYQGQLSGAGWSLQGHKRQCSEEHGVLGNNQILLRDHSGDALVHFFLKH